jgi:hypothetical protein
VYSLRRDPNRSNNGRLFEHAVLHLPFQLGVQTRSLFTEDIFNKNPELETRREYYYMASLFRAMNVCMRTLFVLKLTETVRFLLVGKLETIRRRLALKGD